MLSNQIVVTEDVNTYTLDRMVEVSNAKTEYWEVGHTSVLRKLTIFSRTFAKRAGNFLGVDRGTIKVSNDVEVSGLDTTTTHISPAICTIGASLPVGISEADATLLIKQACATALTADGLKCLIKANC